VVNYTDVEIPYTRIIEHKHFEFGTQDKTVITREFSLEANSDSEPYYPVNDKANEKLAQQYRSLSAKEEHVHFGGRLAEYKYFDMDQIVYNVLNLNL
jgi:UDP-galactopyranose mutase